MTQGHLRRKTILRSSIVFILILSILISCISISFAYSEGEFNTADSIIDSVPQRTDINYLYPGPATARSLLSELGNSESGYIVADMMLVPNGDTYYLTTIISSGDLLILPQNNSFGVSKGVYCSAQSGKVTTHEYSYGYSQGVPSTYTFSNNGFTIGDYGTYYYCGDNTLYNRLNKSNAIFYSSSVIGFPEIDFFAIENLDISAYLPDPHYFDVARSDPFIVCECNFDPREWNSFVTVWGYNEFGSILYIYGEDEYKYISYDIHDNVEIWSWSLDLNAIFSAYIGTEIHISSVSLYGWYDGYEAFHSVDWDFNSVITPGEYDPPDSNYYYTTYYNENYHYAEQNGNVVSFGNVDICLYSDQTLDRVFWDKQKTLLTPYKYSYVFLPVLYIGDSYYKLLDELCLEFDVVICNCPDAVFDAMYGSGASAEFRNLSTTNALVLWYTSKFRFYDVIDYSYFDNLPGSNYTSYDCTALYTDSFYFKSLSYLFGDNNERLLEFETRILGEDGAFQELLKSLKTMYNNDYDYYTGMLTYMSKLNYIVQQVSEIHYFENVLKYLKTISEKDFTIDLPEFDFTTVLGKYPDSNLSNLTDFISHSVSELPTWDFSSLSTFTNAIGDLFTSVAPDGEFIENISEPYTFGDSVEDDLFPDSE